MPKSGSSAKAASELHKTSRTNIPKSRKNRKIPDISETLNREIIKKINYNY